MDSMINDEDCVMAIMPRAQSRGVSSTFCNGAAARRGRTCLRGMCRALLLALFLATIVTFIIAFIVIISYVNDDHGNITVTATNNGINKGNVHDNNNGN